jgi:hypothetical protein
MVLYGCRVGEELRARTLRTDWLCITVVCTVSSALVHVQTIGAAIVRIQCTLAICIGSLLNAISTDCHSLSVHSSY